MQKLGQTVKMDNPLREVDVELIFLHITAREDQLSKDLIEAIMYEIKDKRPHAFIHPEDKEPLGPLFFNN